MPRRPLFYLGADHAGFALKETLKDLLTRYKVAYEDLSPVLVENDDYPQVGKQVAKKVLATPDAQGVLFCGTGMGIAMAANRFRGIRAAVAQTAEDAAMAREHNHANILVLGGRTLTAKRLTPILEAWLKTKPSRASRHIRRVSELDTL
jgi:ribose 5-phosphate isomerase B